MRRPASGNYNEIFPKVRLHWSYILQRGRHSSIADFYSDNKNYLHALYSSFHPSVTVMWCPLNSQCLQFSSEIHRVRKHIWCIESEMHCRNSLGPVSGKLSCAQWGSPSLSWCQYPTYKIKGKKVPNSAAWKYLYSRVLRFEKSYCRISKCECIMYLYWPLKQLYSFKCWNMVVDQFSLISSTRAEGFFFFYQLQNCQILMHVEKRICCFLTFQ